MKKDVEDHARTIQRKVLLEEQARLKEREANRLNKNASRIKNKKPFPLSTKVLPQKEIRKVMQVAPQTLQIFFPAASAGRHQRKWQSIGKYANKKSLTFLSYCLIILIFNNYQNNSFSSIPAEGCIGSFISVLIQKFGIAVLNSGSI